MRISEATCIPIAGAGILPRTPTSKSSCLLRFQYPVPILSFAQTKCER